MHLILLQPVGDVGETKSMSKEVVLGGDVWDLLDELMVYMGNPMQYYEREVKFVRVSQVCFMKDKDSYAGLLPEILQILQKKVKSSLMIIPNRVFFSLDLLELAKHFLRGH